MSLEAGARIGPYEVVCALGQGGMGEVYRGRDSRLGRDVAIKTLPAAFARDPERNARFAREAQLLAALNHSHIAGIYGVEEDGTSRFLILEFIDGVSLAEQLAHGPLSRDEAVTIARQIADALEAAHEKGIIHRDLKPANIMLTADGQAKVLDFGLARTETATDSSVSAMNSPTLTAAATAAGVILGTAAYMAPEQAKGKAVDKRVDIWAFGVVLFEMLTGARPFGGDTLGETVAAIIKDPPAWNLVPDDLTPSLRVLLERTLQKDPRQRLRDIGEARLALDQIATSPAPIATPTAAPKGIWREAVPWAVAAVSIAAAIAMGLRSTNVASPELPPLTFSISTSPDPLERTAVPAISPDGRHLAFVRNGALWVRDLDKLEAGQLTGTDGAQHPFWSPDSRQIAYLQANAAWRVGIEGAPPVRVAGYRFPISGRTPGGVWLADDTLVFAPAAEGTGLFSVAPAGGDFSALLTPESSVESDFHRPSLLPDGRSLLFVVDHFRGGPDTIGVLANGARTNVLTIEGGVLDSPVYSPTGHILFQRETGSPGIWAVPFDVSTLAVTGTPFLVAAEGSFPTIATTGTLIYCEKSVTGLTTLSWLDLESAQVTPATTGRFPSLVYPRLSPSGRYVAAGVYEPSEGSAVIVVDLHRDTHIRLAADLGTSFGTWPVWAGERMVVYSRLLNGAYQLVGRPVDGSAGEVVLTAGIQATIAAGRLVFARGANGKFDLFHMASRHAGANSGPPQGLEESPAGEMGPALSPDGTLLAYSLGNQGDTEVILRTYPAAAQRWQVSSGGGAMPVWSPRGDALYYRTVSGALMRVDVRRTPTVTLGTPREVRRPSRLITRVGYDVSPDGKRLLMVDEGAGDVQRGTSVTVAQNWFASFKRSR
jgi:serine/threonine protein kinase/Tol biopolymer transport system component